MAYPRELLSPNEQVVSEFRPHWFQVVVPALITLAVAVGVVLVVMWTDGTVQLVLVVGLLAVWAFFTIASFARWWFEEHIITSERIIHRTGVISKKGTEIPLEQLNTVTFSQSLIERLVGAGDLRLESAATGGTLYENIPDPEKVQTLIYQVREERQYDLNRGGAPAAQPGPGPGSSGAEQLQILSRLHDEGKLTDEEFQEQKRRLLGS